MTYLASVGSRQGSTEPLRGPAGTAASKGGCLVIPADAVSHVDGQRVKFFTAPQNPSYQPGLTVHGLIGQALLNDSGATIRMVGGMPYGSWTQSPLYPDAPNSPSFAVMGFTTATHAVTGVHALYRSAQGLSHASDVGDKTGYKLGLVDLGKSVAKTGLGLGYAGFRTVTIGSVVNPSNPVWASLAPYFWLAGNTGGGLFYGGIVVADLYAIDRNFMKKYENKCHQFGSAGYMRRRLGFDQHSLESKALKGKTTTDLRKAGMEHLKAFAKTNMDLFKKYGLDPGVQTQEEFIETFLTGDEIEDAGREALIGKLKAKKIDKMSRAIGDESVRKLSRLFSEDREVENAEVDKIVLSGLKTTNKWRYFRAVVYTIGVISMILLCIFTGGAPLLYACIVYTFVAVGEVLVALQILNQQKAVRDAPPGEKEKIVPYVGIVGTLIGAGVQIALASIFSLGILPIAIGLGMAVVYLCIYLYHMHTVDERRVAHGHYLLDEKKGELSLEEFHYLCTYMPDYDLARKSPLDRLGCDDRQAIKTFMSESGNRPWRESLLHGLRRRQEQIEQEYVREFWDRYQTRIHLAAI